VLTDIKRGTYKKLVISEGRLIGAVLVGETGDALWYLELIRTRESIATIRADMNVRSPASDHLKGGVKPMGLCL